MIPQTLEGRLHELASAFLHENAKINLSAFRTPEACWTGNILDSLAALETIHNLHPPTPSSREEGADKNKWKKPSTPENLLSFAREMRKQPTEAEEKLWGQLRFDVLGVRFRRQYILDGAIFDFFCPQLNLVIEVDGDIHDETANTIKDKKRDEYFYEEHHIKTLRFTNDEIFNNLENVMNIIKQQIQKHSPSHVERGLGGEVRSFKILDLGTGGGFPLLPLAICLPSSSFVGVDSVQKKISAVQRIIDELKITNVRLVCGRSEELARESAHREQYDIVLSRALAPLNILLELAAPFLKVGGHILCWKSLHIDQELQDALLARSELSCQMEKPSVYDLGGNWGKRQILVFKKRSATKAKYPRAVGEPKKNPLL